MDSRSRSSRTAIAARDRWEKSGHVTGTVLADSIPPMLGQDLMQAGIQAETLRQRQKFYLAMNQHLGRNRQLGEPVEITVANCLFLSRFHKCCISTALQRAIQ